jgi:hypothetical protein
MPFKHLWIALAFLARCLSDNFQGLHYTLSKICTKFDEVPLSDPSRNHIRPNTQLQIKGCNKSAYPPSCMKFCTWTPKIC